jgi:serine/threonine protein kinase
MSDSRSETTALPLALARRVDELCCRFESDWKAVSKGFPPPRLESFLDGLPEKARTALLRELLKVETHHRRLAGEEPHIDDYRARLPELDTAWLAGVLAAKTTAFATCSMPVFLDVLRKSGLLDPTLLGATIDYAGRIRHPEELAVWLVNLGWLTAYQARRVLFGQAEELTLGDYHLLEPLGSGGMGCVFKARHVLMNRVVAIKRIRPDAAHDQDTVRRFRLEMRAAAKLNHPNVVTVHDAEEVNGSLFLVMELCEGMTLHEVVERKGPLPEAEACEYVLQACMGLQHAFERGLVHRDLKPDNLMLCGTTVKILDFGLAQLRGDSSPVSTQKGVIVGTADYMSPEQAEGRPDIRSDMYSLGCTLYFLLTGRPPFPGGTLLEKCLRHQNTEPEPLELIQPAVSARTQNVVRQFMAKNPAERFQTPAEAVAALTAVPRSDSTKHKVQTQQAPVSKLLKAKARLAVGPRVTPRIAAVLAIAAVSLAVSGASLRLQEQGRAVAPESPLQAPRAWRKSNALPIPPDQAATYAITFSPDGRLVAAAFGNHEGAGPITPGRVRLWEVAEGRLLLDRKAETGSVNCVAFSPGGEYLVWGTGSWHHDAMGHVTLWNAAKGEVFTQFDAHTKGVLGVAFQPRGNVFVTSGREGKVLLWDNKTGKPCGELKDAQAPIVALAFSPDGKRLAIGDDVGYVELWDVGTRKRLDRLSDYTGRAVRGLAFSADGNTLLAATKRGDGTTAYLLVWQGRKQLPAIALGNIEAYCLAHSPGRDTVLVGCGDTTARLFETATRKELQKLPSEKQFFCLAFSPTNRLLATSGGWFGPVQLWEAAE